MHRYSIGLYSLFLMLQNFLLNDKIFLRRFPIEGRWQLSCLCGKELLGAHKTCQLDLSVEIKKTLKYLEIRSSIIITPREVTVLLQNFLVFLKGKYISDFTWTEGL